jgi:hypothetical protein
VFTVEVHAVESMLYDAAATDAVRGDGAHTGRGRFPRATPVRPLSGRVMYADVDVVGS